jgi:hypothetical protein
MLLRDRACEPWSGWRGGGADAEWVSVDNVRLESASYRPDGLSETFYVT